MELLNQKKGESSQGQRCRIRHERSFSHCHALQRDNLYSYTSPGRVPRPPHWHKEGVFFSFGPMVEIWISFARYPKLHRQYRTRKWRSTLACWRRSVCFIITEQSYGGLWTKHLNKPTDYHLFVILQCQLPCNFCSSSGCNWFWKGNQGPLRCNCRWRAWGCSKRWWGIQDSE